MIAMAEEKKWTKQMARGLLENDPVAVIRGIVAIYNYQTADEQVTEHTQHQNGVGLSGADDEFLTSLAKQILNGRSLSEKQFSAGKKAMMKYAGQLARIANHEQ